MSKITELLIECLGSSTNCWITKSWMCQGFEFGYEFSARGELLSVLFAFVQVLIQLLLYNYSFLIQIFSIKNYIFRLEHLSLKFCNMLDKSTEKLMHVLHFHDPPNTPILVSLNLANNGITDVGAGFIARMLRTNRYNIVTKKFQRNV